MATHSHILAWRIPMDRFPMEGYGPRGRRESDMTERLSTAQRTIQGFPESSVGKESSCNAGDPGSILGLGRSAGEGIGYPL